MRATVLDQSGQQTRGELLYVYYYPATIADRTGAIQRVEQRVQRVGLLTEDLRRVHFTVPPSVTFE